MVALRTPERVAVVEGERSLSYQQLYHDLIRMGRALQQLGIGRGQRVAVSRPGFYAQLVLLIACENLGAVSAPFAAGAGADDAAQALLGHVRWVLSEQPLACPDGVRFTLLDASFFQAVAAIPTHDGKPYPRVVLALHEPQRLGRSSGSTGAPNFMLLSRQVQEHWIRIGTDNGAYRADSRLLLEGPLVINAAFTRACACLRLGAAVLSLDSGQVPAADFSHVWALPMRLEQLLQEVPPGYAAARKVLVNSGGGFVSPLVRQRVLEVFASDVISGYGTNEVAGICVDLDGSGTGLLAAGVDIRILDPQTREVPLGEIGVIAVRTPAMVDGYLDAPQASAAAFRDGWFISGDLGALVATRTLRLVGRHDDLLSIGGIKIPASRLEDRIRALEQVRDCAALTIHAQAGAATIGLVLVLEPGAERAAVVLDVERVLEAGTGAAAQMVLLDALPRNPGGKLDRLALQRLFQPAPL